MIPVALVPVGPVPDRLIAWVAGEVSRRLGLPCRVESGAVDPAVAFHPERQQYHSTELLEELGRRHDHRPGKLLGLTPVDLYIPILKYVFGEAELSGRLAVVGYYRLRDEFYGLPANASLLAERTVREAVHELGHTFGLVHCDTWWCVMSSAHTVERVDLRSGEFCPPCFARLRLARDGA